MPVSVLMEVYLHLLYGLCRALCLVPGQNPGQLLGYMFWFHFTVTHNDLHSWVTLMLVLQVPKTSAFSDLNWHPLDRLYK